MMKHEFEARIGTEITAEQYELVEYVYMYSELDKDDVANIWKAEGPARIEAMAYRMKWAEAEEKATQLEVKVERLNDDIEEYKKALVDSRRELKEAKDEIHDLKQIEKGVYMNTECQNALMDAGRNLRELREANERMGAEAVELRETVAKLEAELREACVALFRAQREVA